MLPSAEIARKRELQEARRLRHTVAGAGRKAWFLLVWANEQAEAVYTQLHHEVAKELADFLPAAQQGAATSIGSAEYPKHRTKAGQVETELVP